MTTQIFQSRFGYHPCSYETFKKLKFLNKIYYQALHSTAAWRRWKRKDPHNRIMRRKIRNEQKQVIGYEEPKPMPEPLICPIFAKKIKEKAHWDKYKYHKDGFLDDFVVLDNAVISSAYYQARMPAPTPENVVLLNIKLEDIDALYNKAVFTLKNEDLKIRSDI